MLKGRKRIWLMVLMLTILMVGSVSGSSVYNQAEKRICKLNFGNILYVGGSGESNYTKIQDAIDNASDGDTVFVYDDSSPYYENIIINKAISLTGEDRISTIINGIDHENVVTLVEDKVTLSGFTIKNGSGVYPAGISVSSNYNTISDNIIIQNEYGIYLDGSVYITLTGNTISDNLIINNNYIGLILVRSTNNLVSNNIIQNNSVGIELVIAKNNNISNNAIINNGQGIDLMGNSSNNKIQRNNIYMNLINARFFWSYGNIWKGNYWGNIFLMNKFIFGIKRIFLFSILIWPREESNVYLYLPMINIDWNPAQEPFDIGE
jgi:parallel beta-helix repeat protein